MRSMASGLRFVDPQFRALLAAVRNGDAKPIQFWNKKRCPRSGSGRNSRLQMVIVGSTALKNVNEPLAAGDVDALMGRVIKNIVGVANTGQAGEYPAGLCIKNQQLGRVAAAHKE